MTETARWADALLAARLLAQDAAGLGGIVVRAAAGPVRDAWLAHLGAYLSPETPFRKLPIHAQDERILGGLDLTATLEAGHPVARRGILAEADGGIVVAAMAERMSDLTAAHLAGALDRGEIVAERDGLASRLPARIAVVALDEGAGPDEAAPAALIERCAFLIDLSDVAMADVRADPPEPSDAGDPIDADTALATLCATALAFGIDSARAPLLAMRAARALAALDGRAAPDSNDVTVAARLVLAPRATRIPAGEDAPPPPAPEAEEPKPGKQDEDRAPSELTDLVVAAAQAMLPKDLLAATDGGVARRTAARGGRGSGQRRRSNAAGRPAGVRAGDPGAGARLSVIDTLRAAAPWQTLRRPPGSARLAIRKSDLRVRRTVERAQAATIFVVDASGSAAVARLAEAKGAVELLLAEAYVRRAQVALVAFRGQGAEIMLPPTRSLARAKRCLAGMAGGGGTPVAAGIAAGQALAEAAAAKGQTPQIVLMTDGRANVSLDGVGGRAQAEEEALAAARRIGAAGIAGVVIDIGARPRDEAARLATAMAAVYAPLPKADAGAMAAVVRNAK